MDLGLQDRVALVFGAGGGLGGAIATALADEGCAVAVADIDDDAAQRQATAIVAAGGRAIPVTWDLADPNRVPSALAEIQQVLGAVDILINNTGGPPPTPAAGQDPTSWRRHFDSMVVSVIAVTDAVLPGMRSRRWGRIVTSTSSGVVAPIANLAISNALRLSLLGWSKTLAREVAADGVTVNVLVPGRIATRRTRALDEARAKREGRTVAEVEADSCATIPTGRYGDPREYADAATFLASNRAAYITGSTLRVDGGLIPSL